MELIGDLRRALGERIDRIGKVRRRRIDLGPDRRGRAHEGRDLGRDHERVPDRGPWLKGGGNADYRDTGLARDLAEAATGGGENALRADRLRGLEAGDRLLRVA